MSQKKKIFKKERFSVILAKRILPTLLMAIVAFACTFFGLDKKTENAFNADCEAAVQSCLSALETSIRYADTTIKVMPHSKTTLCGVAKAMEKKGYNCYVSLDSPSGKRAVSDSSLAVEVYCSFDNEATDYFYNSDPALIEFIKSVRLKYLGNEWIDAGEEDINFNINYGANLANLRLYSGNNYGMKDVGENEIRRIFFVPKKLYFVNQSEFEVPEVTAIIQVIDCVTGKMIDEYREVQTFETSKAEEDYFHVAGYFYKQALETTTDPFIEAPFLGINSLHLCGGSTPREFYKDPETDELKVKGGIFDSNYYYRGTTIDLRSYNVSLAASVNRLELNKNMYLAIGAVYLVISVIIGLLWAIGVYRKNKYYFAMEEYRKNLLNCVAHDLKTPLTIMNGYAQNLMDNVRDEKKDHYAASIVKNAEYMNSLIENILTLSRTESGVAIKRVKTDLIELTEKLYGKYEESAREKDLTVSIGGTLFKDVDETLMSCCIDNLLSNALKYSKPGSEITVFEQAGKFVIENVFEGKLIKPAQKLWEPFSKEDSSRSGNTGSGLGLSIVKNILDMHGYEAKIIVKDDVFRIEFM